MKRALLATTASLLACAAIVHCGDDSSSSPSPDAGTPTPPTPGPTTTPTPPHPPPPPSSDGGDDAGEDATVVTTQGPEGAVEVTSYGFTNPTPQSGWSMLASFSHPATTGYTLTTTTIGACIVRVQSAPAALGTQDSAGDVTFSQAATTLATATFGGSGYTVDGGSATTPIVPGGSFHIAAAGATVPAFAVDLDSAYPVTIMDPDLPDSGPVVIDRSKDLTMNWTGGTPGDVVVIFFGADNGLTQVRCELDGAAQTAKIPQAALGKLPAGSGGLGAFARQGTTVDAGGRPVDVSLTFVATSRTLRQYQALLAQYN